MVGGRKVMTNFGGINVVLLQGTIVVCYGWGAEGNDQFWWSGRGAIIINHGWGAEGNNQFWWSGLGAIVVCYGWGGGE